MLLAIAAWTVAVADEVVTAECYWPPDKALDWGGYTVNDGKITPVGQQSVVVGGSIVFTAHPETGWSVKHWRESYNKMFMQDLTDFGSEVADSSNKTELEWKYDPVPAYVAVRFGWLSYDVSYLADGVKVDDKKGISYKDKFDLAEAPTAPKGYSFKAWTNSFDTVEYDAGQQVEGSSFSELNDIHVDGHVVKLFARWTANAYAVTLDRQLGTGGDASVTATYDAALPKIAPPTRDGWTFAGYFTEADGKGTKYYDAQGNGTKTWTETDVATLYAYWTQKFTVTFYEASQFWKGGTEETGIIVVRDVEAGADAVPPDDPEHEGYTFNGWSGNYRAVTKNEKVRATYTGNSYTVRFNKNDGSGATTTQQFEYGKDQALLNNPLPRTGYTLQGWTDDPSSHDVKYKPGATVSNLATGGVVNLYALWEPVSYTVHFHPNGGDGTMEDASVGYDAAFVVPDCTFTKPGCVFKDWIWTHDGQTTNFVAGSVVSNLTASTGTLTFTANWIGYYVVTFDKNGGQGQMTNVTYEVGTANRLPANAFAKEGHSFGGWATNATEAAAKKVTYADEEEVVMPMRAGETNNLFAVWTANSYTVVFDGNGATEVAMDPQPFVYDVPQNLRENTFARGEFWKFVGWTNEVANAFYTNGEEVVNLTAEPNGRVELKAVWETTLSDLSLAMGCYNLNWKDQQGKWVVCTTEGSDGPPCVSHVGGQDYIPLSATISTNGTLTFMWKPTSTEIGLHVIVMGARQYLDEKVVAAKADWQPATVEVPALNKDDAPTVAIFQEGGGGAVFVDQMRWTPAGSGGEPTPGPAVTPTAAGVADGVFSLTIPTASGKSYGVWTNANLLIDSWGLMGEPQKATGDSLKFEWTILPELPQLFFRAHEVEYR